MARTGSGKTAAFLVPMFERLKAHSVKVGRHLSLSLSLFQSVVNLLSVTVDRSACFGPLSHERVGHTDHEIYQRGM